MSDPQGLRPFDPYRTLQLHPAAPRDLVEKAYWLLASSVHSSPVSGSRIEELNAAYAMLVDDDARRSYDEAHGVRALAAGAARSPRPRLRLFSAKTPGVRYDDCYHVLRIDSEADSRIVQLAYDFWTHGLQGARVERELIEEAHRTLSNPQLRAQYDARRGESAGPQKVEITKQVHAQIQIARHNENEGTSAVPNAVVDGAMTSAPGGAPKLAPAVDAAPRSSNGAPVEAAATVAAPAVQPAAADVATDAARAPSAPGPPVAPAPRSPAERRVEALAAAVVAVATDAAPAPPEPPAEPAAPRHEARPAAAIGRGDARPAAIPGGRAQLEAPATKLPSGRQLAEAQQNRLLQLREDAVTLAAPAPAFAPAPREQLDAAATLAFISGPRTGERIELARDVVTLGSDSGCAIVIEDATANIEREHAHLMRRGATYMFHDLAGHDTTIADRPLTLPVVMLEDGDEIQIGAHRMRFAIPRLNHRPASTAAEAS